MRVKVLNVVLDNRIGGVQTRVLAVTPMLARHGIDTLVLTPANEGQFFEQAGLRGISVEQLTYYYPHRWRRRRSLWMNAVWATSFVPSVLSIANLIRRSRIHIVHVNGLMGFQAALAAKLTHRKLVWHLIGTVYPRWMVHTLMPLVIRLADTIVLVAYKMAKYYLLTDNGGHSKVPVHVIYEPADVTRILTVTEADRRQVRDELQIGDKDVVISSVGHLNPSKGYEYLIRAAVNVREVVPNVRFFVAGANLRDQAAYWERLGSLVHGYRLAGTFHFLGQRSDIPALLSISHVFVLPSLQEGTPIAILEAMAAGLPVVASDVGGIAEQVLDGETGYVVQPYDEEGLTDALLDLLSDSSKRRAFGQAGRERVWRLFLPETCAEKHATLYRSLLGRVDTPPYQPPSGMTDISSGPYGRAR